MKPSSLIVEIHHHAGVDAANAVKVKQRELIDFNALQGSTLNHENSQIDLNYRCSNPALISARQARWPFKIVRDRDRIFAVNVDDNLAECARKFAKMR